jgi:hypothetical protein
MALPRLRAAVANGNWSDSSTWNDGVLPSVNDVVALNDFNVTVDQDINVYQLTNFQSFYTSYNSFSLMTWNDEPEGLAESSFNDFRSYYPFSNGLDTDVFTSNSNPLWYSYEYPNQESIVISRYSFGALGNHPYDPRDWKFQGWNATTQLWEDVDSQVNQTNYGGTYLSSILSNTTAYTKYRIIVFQVRNGNGTCRIWRFRFYEKNTYFGTTTVARGTSTVDDSRNITIGEGNLRCANLTTLMRFSSPSGSVINFNGKIDFPLSNNLISSVEITGTGTYNFTGDMVATSDYSGSSGNGINITQPCVVNFYGTVYANRGNGISSAGIRIIGTAIGSTVNVFGNVEGAGSLSGPAIVIFSSINLNVYGDVHGARLLPNPQYGGPGIYCNNNGANIVIVGNVIGSLTHAISNQGERHGMRVDSANRVEITGNVVAGTYIPNATNVRHYGLLIGSVTTLSIIGTIQASDREAGLISSASLVLFEAPNFYNHQLSGPFITGPTGIAPFRASSFKLISNVGKYYQFRDLNLNTTSMVSPDILVDLPPPSDVRLGTSYGSGNYVGSLAVPPTNRVSAGIAVDNTVGAAILTATDVWNVQTTALNVAGSVGVRLKNVATIGMVGAQLEAFLKKD